MNDDLEFSNLSSFESDELIAKIRHQESSPKPIRLSDLTIDMVTLHSSAIVRCYQITSPRNPEPLIIFLHGGGWTFGNSANNDDLCAYLTRSLGVRTYSIEYPLAPENPYPAAMDYCSDVVKHCFQNANELKIDPSQIVVIGTSAGANLAASLCLRLRDEGHISIACQVLVYPVLDASLSSNSYQLSDRDYSIGREQMKWFWRNYLGARDGTSDYLASPSSAADLTGLPATLIIAAERDILRDEAIEYAANLARFDVRAKLIVVPGARHGFLTLEPESNAAVETKQNIATTVGEIIGQLNEDVTENASERNYSCP